ncbi:MAG: FtsW/RodA/SpoVE family cell cycle protein [Bacteroidales bacterium]|nr:FtsW/RodA/SpoVE family cell cycle protein [Bacteroidales bacterium]
MKKIGQLFKLKGDPVIWAICIILSCISLIAVYSSIGYTAITKMNTTPTLAFVKHAFFIIIAYAAALVVSNLNYQLFSRISTILYLCTVALIFLLMLTKSRWFHIPFIGSVQPSEWAKICAIIFTARTLTLHKDDYGSGKLFWISLLPMSLIAALIMPENLSTALLVFAVGLIMMFLGGVRTKHILITIGILIVIGSLSLTLSYKIFHSELAVYARESPLKRAETWSNRIDHWLNPDEASITQENMAKMAIADGGLLRMNIGGTVHARLMTQANNDFIYAIIVEETGSIVGIIIFLLYTILFYRCIMLSYWSGRRYGGLLIIGLGTSIYLQAIVHMCVCVGIIPVTGQTLPLISTGGTAYLLTGFSIGLIQSVVRSTSKKKKSNMPQSAADKDIQTHSLTS